MMHLRLVPRLVSNIRGLYRSPNEAKCLVTPKSSLQLGNPAYISTSQVNLLYSPDFLGTDKYADFRRKTQQQFGNLKDKFMQRMEEYIIDDSKAVVFTEDLKNIIYLMENTEGDILLLKSMIKRFNSQNQSLRFGTFVFGPVVMRMVHHMGNAELGLELLYDPETKGFFDQLSSYLILADLLFEQGKHDEVQKLIPHLQEQGFSDTRYPRDLLVVAIASCYKLGTREAYDTAVKFLFAARDAGIQIPGKAAALFSSLALSVGEPQAAMEVLSVQNGNYITTRNLRIIAFADVGRPEDALNIIRIHLNQDSMRKPLAQICEESITHLTAAIEKRNDPLLTQEFHQICRALKEGNHISPDSLDKILSTPVVGAGNIKPLPQDPFDYQSRLGDSKKFSRAKARNMNMRDTEEEVVEPVYNRNPDRHRSKNRRIPRDKKPYPDEGLAQGE